MSNNRTLANAKDLKVGSIFTHSIFHKATVFELVYKYDTSTNFFDAKIKNVETGLIHETDYYLLENVYLVN